MFKYINILLDDSSVSFCHYDIKKKANPISEDILNQGIRFAMKENLNIQFIYPRSPVPSYIDKLVHQVDHIKIGRDDVIVYDSWPNEFELDKICVVRIAKNELLSTTIPEPSPVRLNIVITDIESFKEEDFVRYRLWLDREASRIKQHFRHVSILTDRLVLDRMNNCNAGWESITLAPNGKFYICPAFYQNDMQNVGDLECGLEIPNERLYQLDYAPICSHCDAFHCKRCIWLNLISTLELNTPSHEQCVIAHLERNASRIISADKIPEINYLDPFDII